MISEADRQKFSTDCDGDGRVKQHNVILSQVWVVWVLFVDDDGGHLHAFTVQHGLIVDQERDQDWDGQICKRRKRGLKSVHNKFYDNIRYFVT